MDSSGRCFCQGLTMNFQAELAEFDCHGVSFTLDGDSNIRMVNSSNLIGGKVVAASLVALDSCKQVLIVLAERGIREHGIHSRVLFRCSSWFEARKETDDATHGGLKQCNEE